MEDQQNGTDGKQEKQNIEIVIKGDKLSIISQDLTEIDPQWGETYGKSIQSLDLSYNAFKQIDNLEKFTEVHTLSLDNNKLEFFEKKFVLKKVDTLSVNNNQISDLKNFMDFVEYSFPNLRYLSMLKNPACPNYFVGKDFDDYKRYRLYVIYRLKNLKFLDSTNITEQEIKDAKRQGPYMIPAKPDQSQYQRQVKQEHENLAPLPQDLQPEGKGSAKFGVTSYVYYGKHSEGNRFILNEHL